MKIVWDEPKRAMNLRRHGLDFVNAASCDWTEASVTLSYLGRRGGQRYVATLPWDGDLVSIVFAPLGSEAISVISMRRASRKERKNYAQAFRAR